MTGYDRAGLTAAYHAVGVAAGGLVYLTGNLGRLGFPVDESGALIRDKTAIAELHLSVLQDILGPDGTIVFPTHSWAEVNAATVFDPATTPCDYPLSQHILTYRDSRRQIHPFASVAATGVRAAEIIDDTLSPHAYGVSSPFDSMTRLGALHVALGLPVARSISAVHHCEALAQVPYRYIKGFRKDILLNGISQPSEVFLHVLYRAPGLTLERDQNVKITALPAISAALIDTPVGRSRVASVPLDVFVPETIAAMRRDPYIWLRRIEGNGPWMT
ncbi:MAG: AAC(3) family N-acetyltransferase [Rubellimicrobium sp.]|nr:AAC(3) family N-acetyltransferase [Rubellimicrobium sp.]